MWLRPARDSVVFEADHIGGEFLLDLSPGMGLPDSRKSAFEDGS